MTACTIFTGARIFDGAQFHDGAALVVRAGHVAGIVPRSRAPEGDVVALGGGILAPGFLDLQVNGGGGVMLGGPEVTTPADALAQIRRICAAHGALGATGLLPTLITDRPEVTAAVLEAGALAAEEEVPGFLGLHIEGPHLDPRRKGAHDPALIRPMEAADLDRLCRAAGRMPALLVTLAPESATEAQIAALAAAGVTVSLGHSDCTLAVARAGFAAGARCVTHLFNAMSPLGHREPGLVGAALDTGAAHGGVIADLVHVAPEALRVALLSKRGPGKLFLVTDAMAVAGTGAESFTLGGREILRRDGRLTLADGTLAGADISLPQSIRNLVQVVGLDLAATLAMASAGPAAAVGLGGRAGHILPGRAADLVHLDEDLGLAGVWRAGVAI